ncbi:ABC transporter permease [Arthrobacter sp. W1]|nr:ABC transporter permease [Arthrobacter sp. W1]
MSIMADRKTTASLTGSRPAAKAKARSSLASTPRGRLAIGTTAVLLVLAFWELAWRTELLPTMAFPAASGMLQALGLLLATPSFWASLWSTISVALLGLALIILIATPVAMLIGLVKRANDSTWFLLEFLKPIPPVALIPLGLLLWGPTPGMKLFLIVFGAIWPLLTQLVYGVREIDGTSTDMARSYRMGRWLTIRHVMLPALLPFAMTGLRISASIAIIIAVVTEMIGGADGLGQDIVVAQSAGAIDQMYALIFATGILGLLFNAGFRGLDKPLLFWHPSVRKDNAS